MPTKAWSANIPDSPEGEVSFWMIHGYGMLKFNIK
jgi:hypothetical protein